MYQSIFLPTDGSELSSRAADAAIELAKTIGARLITWSGAEAYILPFATQSDVDRSLLIAEGEREAKMHVDSIVNRAKAAGVSCQGYASTTESPWEDIINTAEKHGCDLIFMASHGQRGIAALLLGSETQKVLTHSKVPVLVYR